MQRPSNPFLLEQLSLALIVVITILIRIQTISKYGFSEDEILKLYAVRDYQEGNFSTNAQLPALMKLLATLSVMLFGENEFALRFPNVIFAGLTVYPIYYLSKELYDKNIGLMAVSLWSVDIPAIAFSTIAKEDTLLTFFWVFTIYYIVKAKENQKYYRHVGICVGLAIASKYTGGILIILLLAIYWLYKRNNIENLDFKQAFKRIFPFATLSFFIANFPILLFQTQKTLYEHWVNQNKIVPPRHGFIMMDNLFNDRPLYYLIYFFAFKMTLPMMICLLLGIIAIIKSPNLSNHILLLWIVIPVIIFSLMSGYLRYLLVILPALMILASIGVFYLVDLLYQGLPNGIVVKLPSIKVTASSVLVLVSLSALIVGLSISPFYRMYVNEIGGGDDRYGYYFPQDSVYDYYFKEAVEYINQHAPINTTIASHLTLVAQYYSRADLSHEYILNLPEDISIWQSTFNISYVIIQDSRTYLENQNQIENIRANIPVEKVFTIEGIVVIEIYKLDS